MNKMNQNRLKGLMLGGALFAVSFSAFAATEGGIDIGATQTTEKGWVQVTTEAPAVTNYIYPARIPVSLNSKIMPKPAINVSAADFKWVIGETTNHQATANVTWFDADGKTAKMFDPEFPAGVTLNNVAVQPFFAGGTWSEKRTLVFNPEQAITCPPIVPEVSSASGGPKDQVLTDSIAGESINYTYSITPEVPGFSVNSSGIVTIAAGTVGTCTVKVELNAVTAKWETATPQLITVEVEPIIITDIEWTPNEVIIYDGVSHPISATGKYGNRDGTKTINMTVSVNGTAITSLINARVYTVTAAVPHGFICDDPEIPLTKEISIQPFKITSWKTKPAIEEFEFYFGVTPEFKGGYTANGVNNESITAEVATEYTPWVSTELTHSANLNTIAVIGGQALTSNYDLTSGGLTGKVIIPTKALKLTVNPQRTAAYLDEGFTQMLPPTITGAKGAPKAFLDEVEAALMIQTTSNEYFDINGKTVSGKKATEVPQSIVANLMNSEYKFEGITAATYATIEVLYRNFTRDKEIYFTLDGSGDGAIGTPANISRLNDALKLTPARDIRIVNDFDIPQIITDDIIFTTPNTLSSGWVITEGTAVQNPARATIFKGGLTLINDANLNKIVVDATGKTVSIKGGSMDNVTLKLSSELTLPIIKIRNSVIYGATVNPGFSTLSNSAYQVANDADGGSADGTNLLLSESGDFSAKINDGEDGNYKPMNKTEGGGKASILINRGSNVTQTEPAQAEIVNI